MNAVPKSSGVVTKKYAPVVLLVLVLGGVLLFPRIYQAVNQASDAALSGEVLQAPACDFALHACVAQRGDLRIELSVDSTSFRSYEPLQFKLTVQGMTPDTAHIEFEGVEMFMGANALPLQPTPDGGFSGTLSLPGHAYPMTWRARVQLLQDTNLTESEFLFDLR